MKKNITIGSLSFLLPLISVAQDATQSPTTQTATTQVMKAVASEGFSLESFTRGVVGMITLLFIAYLFSSNRRAINWKTIGIGLALQLSIAIGILKVGFIQDAFDFAGSIVVLILEFTRAGSQFLLGNLVDTNSIGYIFAFQVLPTIIFFSALTSLLLYLGVIQVIVRGICLLYTSDAADEL